LRKIYFLVGCYLFAKSTKSCTVTPKHIRKASSFNP
jgi:hypothetical protein